MTGRRSLRWGIGGAVLLAHLMLLWAWPHGARGARDRTPQSPSTTVRLLPAPAAVESDRPVVARRDASSTPARDRKAALHEPVQTITMPSAAPSTATAVVEVPAAGPAASASTLDLRLRLPRGAVAERGGLTESQDSMRRAALNDPRSNVATDPTQVLPRAVASSAKGDCLKGEYAGGGMGLLSLPFLALAAVRDACRPSR
jgi:hypothetical protein